MEQTMAQTLTFPTITMSAFGAASPVDEQMKPVVKFSTARRAADRFSEPTKIVGVVYNESQRALIVLGSDGFSRKCYIDRLDTIESARKLYSDVVKAGKAEKEIRFVAAGGFNPNTWFYAIQE